MSQGGRSYRLTQAGREAWESEDTAVPADYRRLLWMMDFHGHAGVVQGLLRHYPRNILDEWLGEMAELGLIEPVPEGSADMLDATPLRSLDSTLALGQLELREAKAAGAALARTGAYLSVVTSGTVRPGDAIEVVARPAHDITVPDTFRAFMGDLDAADRVLAADCLVEVEAAELREMVAQRRPTGTELD